jgi:hypothetical protein
MKRLLVVVTVIVGGVVCTPLLGPAAAAPKGPPSGSGVAHDATPCADHGGFGALGTFGAGAHDIGVNFPGSNLRPGATSWMFPNVRTGSTTGGNNNSLCGGGNVPSPFAES